MLTYLDVLWYESAQSAFDSSDWRTVSPNSASTVELYEGNGYSHDDCRGSNCYKICVPGSGDYDAYITKRVSTIGYKNITLGYHNAREGGFAEAECRVSWRPKNEWNWRSLNVHDLYLNHDNETFNLDDAANGSAEVKFETYGLNPSACCSWYKMYITGISLDAIPTTEAPTTAPTTAEPTTAQPTTNGSTPSPITPFLVTGILTLHPMFPMPLIFTYRCNKSIIQMLYGKNQPKNLSILPDGISVGLVLDQVPHQLNFMWATPFIMNVMVTIAGKFVHQLPPMIVSHIFTPQKYQPLDTPTLSSNIMLQGVQAQVPIPNVEWNIESIVEYGMSWRIIIFIGTILTVHTT